MYKLETTITDLSHPVVNLHYSLAEALRQARLYEGRDDFGKITVTDASNGEVVYPLVNREVIL